MLTQQRVASLQTGLLAGLIGLMLGALPYQLPSTYRLDLVNADDAALDGFHRAERDGGFRWSTETASLFLPPLGTPGQLRIVAAGYRPANLPLPELQAFFAERPVGRWMTSNAEAAYEAPLRALWLPLGAELRLQSEAYTRGTGNNQRTLGVAVTRVEIDLPGPAGGPVRPPLVSLVLSGLLIWLLQQAARRLGLEPWPSLIVSTGLAGLAIAAFLLFLTMRSPLDRASWQLAAPLALLGLCGLALLPGWNQAGSPVARPTISPTIANPATVLTKRRRLDSDHIDWLMIALAVGLLALHLLSWFLPAGNTDGRGGLWGLRMIYRLPAWLPILLAVPVGLIALLTSHIRLGRLVLDRLAGPPHRPAQALNVARGWLSRSGPPLLAGLAALPLFWLGRARPELFGDSAEITRKITFEAAIWREREPLDFFLHVQAFRLLSPLTGWDVPTVYAVMSCLAGTLFVVAVVSLSARLAVRANDRWLVSGLILSAGFVQLFFGYLESYTLVTAGLAIALLLGLLCLDGRLGPAWPAFGLAAAATLHPIAIAAAPALAILCLARWQQSGYRLRAGLSQLLPALIGLITPFILLVALFIAYGYTWERWQLASRQFGGVDGRTFKPLIRVTSNLERYPLLSFDHPLAWLNEQLLIAPLGWPLVLLLLLWVGHRGLWRDARFAFLFLAAVSTTAFTALWNPDLGTLNDWDLLSIGALPTMALAGYLLVTLPPRTSRRPLVGWLLLAVNLYHTGLWVAGNSLQLSGLLTGGP